MKDIISKWYAQKYLKEVENQQETLNNSTLSYYYKPLFDLILNYKPKTLLDVGCGSAAFSSIFLKYGVKVYGIEFVEQLACKAEERGVEVYRYDLNSEFHITKEFDVVLMSAILEHVWDPDRLVEKLKGNFKHGVIIVSPNMSSLRERIRLLFGFPLNWLYPPGGHIRFMNLKVIKEMAKQNNLQIIDVIGYGISGQRILDKLHLQRYLGKLFPSLFEILIVKLTHKKIKR